MELCPVCMLRKALAGGVGSGASSASEDTVKPTPEQAVQLLHKPAYSAEFWTRAWRCCEAICAMASAVRAKPNRPVLSVTS